MNGVDHIPGTAGRERDALIVDADDPDAERMARALVRLGAARGAARARDGVEALERLGATPPHELPALLVVDFDVPRLNGRELLDACASDPRLASLPRLLVSSSPRTLELDAAGPPDAGRPDVERMIRPATLPGTVAALSRCACVAPLVTRHDLVLVDDDPDVHELARRLLRRSPRRLLSLDGAEAALRRVAGREIELFIVDARMPDGDGLDLLERLRADGTLRARRTVLSSAGRLASAETARAARLGVEVIDKRELFDRRRFAERIADAGADRAAWNRGGLP